VDGFRFDKGSILSRGEDGAPSAHPPLVWQAELDEDLMDTKLIAEAWDAPGLYQIGHFPGDRWSEWNGRFRDTMRRFVKGDRERPAQKSLPVQHTKYFQPPLKATDFCLLNSEANTETATMLAMSNRETQVGILKKAANNIFAPTKTSAAESP